MDESAAKAGSLTPFGVWLESSCYTPTQAAKILGVSRQFLYQLRDGKATPSLAVACKISDLSGGQVPATVWRLSGDDEG